MSPSRFQLWYGRDAAPPERHELRAGPVTATLEGIDLRHICVGGVEAVQRIYVAVRDDVWNTVPATYSDLQIDRADDHFTAHFSARHRYAEIDFSWQGRITGAPDGTITYVMDGVANAAFRYNKIGFNVHHPLDMSVGQPYRARTPEGIIGGTLPELIEPQRVENGLLTAMFPAYSSIAIDLRADVTVQLDFEGDLFEMQDHRNWTDANYKTYGTPLAIPLPLEARQGQALRQQVSVSFSGTLPRPRPATTETRLTLGAPSGLALPPIGAGMASHGAPLSAHEAALLRRLRLDHLRVDVNLADPSWRDRLAQAVDAARAIDAGIELALFVLDDDAASLDALASMLATLPVPLARVLVFPAATGRSPVAGSTPASLMRRVRAQLAEAIPGVPLAGGTDQFFAELNRDHPDVTAMDAVVYSINPQVHASDDTSLVENLAAQAATVQTARSFCGDRPIVVSPVTFIGRAGPWAAGPPQPGDLPPQVAVRQAALFGAGWTAGSVKYLAGSGVASLTYYETTGWLGLIETDAGSPMPDRFPSSPGDVFPLYHVFADLAEWKDGELVDLQTSDRLAVDGLALRRNGGQQEQHVLIANLSPRPQAVVVGPFAAGHVRVRHLDEETAALARSDPDTFRALGASQEVRNRELALSLAPYAVVRIDETG